MEIPAVIEQVLIDNGIVLHIVSKTAKYIAPNSAHGATAAIPQNGVDPHQAAKILHDLVVQARNIVGGRGGLPNAVDALRDDYLNWAETIEIQLLGLTSDSAIVAMLHIDRYWQIRALDETMIRPLPLVDAEIRLQTARLERLANDLSERATRLSSAGGHLTVLDINILLHYLPPAQIRWVDVIGQPSVRLVVPLRVIEELDAKKYARQDQLAKRARSILPAPEAVLGRAGSPGELQPSVTFEVPVDAAPRKRPADADQEILDTCGELRQLTGRQLTLVTADTAMRIRAQAYGVTVLKMPAKYERARAIPSGVPIAD